MFLLIDFLMQKCWMLFPSACFSSKTGMQEVEAPLLDGLVDHVLLFSSLIIRNSVTDESLNRDMIFEW